MNAPRTPDTWIEVQIAVPDQAEELIGLLNESGMAGAWEDQGVVRLYWPADRWSAEVLSHIRHTCSRVSGLEADAADDPARITVGTLPDQDWNETWARAVRPIRVGRRIVVRASWHGEREADLRPGDVELILDPKQAFGTGHHATTQLMLEWLETHIRGGESVLDVGTGSGILAIAALKVGARSALGLDIDPVAIDCAREAAAMNGCGDELRFELATVADGSPVRTLGRDGRWSVVLANLDRGALLSSVEVLMPLLRDGARLVVSGLLHADGDELTEVFGRQGAAMRGKWERDGWIAAEFLVPESCED